MNEIYKLIDLSKWNGKVDFNKVKSSGIDGVIIRTGYGVENPKQVDNRFEEYYKGAKAAGLYVGAYHYSYAKTAQAAEKEAEFMLKIMKGKTFELPLYGDFEEQANVSKTECNNIVSAFCGRLESAGAWAGIYSYDTFFRDKLSADKPKRYTVWVARVENVFPKCVNSADIGIWQNSWKGKIGGITGDVDMDICYRDFPVLIAKSGRNKF
ncbi:MAG: glycoside hydrolase family 25 protein [Ruminococcus sp.]|nr:glycoside hydrolase family 25 protein [Ruminococcus sp.]